MNNHGSSENMNGKSVVPILLLLGVAGLIAAWLFNTAKDHKGLPELTETSRSAIAALKTPIEIRLYSDDIQAETNAPARQFSERASKLVQAYGEAGGERILTKHILVTNEQIAATALADGVRPFNIEKGDAKYLGIVIQAGEKKEVLPILSPDFASALEADLTRAIQRVGEGSSSAQTVALDAPSPSVVESVKSNYASVPFEEGTQKVREKMMSDLKKATSDMDAKLGTAQEAYKKAEAAGNQQQIEAARKALTAVELEHNARLKQIISGSMSEVRALEEMKRQ